MSKDKKLFNGQPRQRSGRTSEGYACRFARYIKHPSVRSGAEKAWINGFKTEGLVILYLGQPIAPEDLSFVDTDQPRKPTQAELMAFWKEHHDRSE